MKLAEPGIARVARATIRNSAASTGARSAIPPISRMSSVPVRSTRIATMTKIGATTSPWLTICRIAPSAPSARRAKIAGGDEAELGDRRVAGDQPHVGLGEGHHRAVEDRGQGDHQDHLLELDRGVGEERQDDAQEAVGADLGEHPGEDDQDRQRRRPVGVRHPAVQEEGRHLDQEGGGEEPEDPALALEVEALLLDRRDREGELAAVGGDDRRRDRPDQHQQRADQGVDHHLQRRRRGRRCRPRGRCPRSRRGSRTGPA